MAHVLTQRERENEYEWGKGGKFCFTKEYQQINVRFKKSPFCNPK